MLDSSPIMAFVATTNPGRALAFYRDHLGLTLIADEPVALVFDANGSMLRVAKVNELSPATYTVLGWKVQDIRSTIKEMTAHGVAFQRYEGLLQDETGVCTFPGGAQVAWFKDPDGNVLSLTQFPATA
jgi:catechol 2,3-dioxygenase-like lactoylglutathione lyase family enzyme